VQVATEQRRHKLSYHLTRETPEQDAAVLQVSWNSTQNTSAGPDQQDLKLQSPRSLAIWDALPSGLPCCSANVWGMTALLEGTSTIND